MRVICVDVVRLELHQEDHFRRRLGRGDRDFLADQILDGLDVGVRHCHQCRFRDRARADIDDHEIEALRRRGQCGRQRDLAVGRVARQDVAHRGAAAARADDVGDVDSGRLEQAFVDCDRKGRAVEALTPLGHRDLLGLGATVRQQRDQSCASHRRENIRTRFHTHRFPHRLIRDCGNHAHASCKTGGVFHLCANEWSRRARGVSSAIAAAARPKCSPRPSRI